MRKAPVERGAAMARARRSNRVGKKSQLSKVGRESEGREGEGREGVSESMRESVRPMRAHVSGLTASEGGGS